MNREDILGLLDRATNLIEVQLLGSMGVRVSNGSLEFENRIPKHLKDKG